MRALVQCVSEARVTVEGETVGGIGKGYLILLGVGDDDTEEQAAKLWRKISRMRVFDDEQGKTNLSLADVDGEVLVVSQFTLFADVRKGNRPSFVKAGKPEHANITWIKFNEALRSGGVPVREGRFGTHMRVGLINDGPVTITIDTDNL